jgi:hypothetical protein
VRRIFGLKTQGGENYVMRVSQFTLFFRNIRNKINKNDMDRFCAALEEWRYS